MKTFVTPAGTHALLREIERLEREHPDKRFVWEVRPYTEIRPLNKNARFHAVCGEIAKHVPWDGEMLDLEAWKRLLVVAWMKATDRKVKLVRSLDGEGFTPIYQRTSLLSKAEMNELIEYAEAFAVDHDVPLWFPGRDEWDERQSA